MVTVMIIFSDCYSLSVREVYLSKSNSVTSVVTEGYRFLDDGVRLDPKKTKDCF